MSDVYDIQLPNFTGRAAAQLRGLLDLGYESHAFVLHRRDDLKTVVVYLNGETTELTGLLEKASA